MDTATKHTESATDPTRVGPNSPAARLQLLDRRTKEGRFLHDTREALIAACGGPARATVQQQLVASLAAIKATRLLMLGDQLLGGDPPEEAERRFIWHANSLARDLKLLGLERRAAEEVPSLAQYLDGQAA